MSIELDFIKRYGPPKYRIDHKLKFHDEELYVVQETPNTDLELMNERLKRDTFSRLTKLYPRQGPSALPVKYKIVNNHPAFRRKSGKEVGSITERVYQPTYSHIQRSKGALDPDEQCSPHQKRMSYSATYLGRRTRSNLSPDGATARSTTSYSGASKQNCKSRPKSCPPPSSKRNNESQEVKKKLENRRRKQYRRRSFFTFLDENFFSDQSQWEEESTKSYGSKLSSDPEVTDIESKNALKKVQNISSGDNSSKRSELGDDSFSYKSDYSADCSNISSDDVDSDSYDSQSRDSDMELSSSLENSQDSSQSVDSEDEKDGYFERNDSSQTSDSSTLTYTSCSDREYTDDLSPKTETDDESVTSVSQTATHSSEYSNSSHSFKEISTSGETENSDDKSKNHSDTNTDENSTDQVGEMAEDDAQFDGNGTILSETDDNMKEKMDNRIPINATASTNSGSQRSLILNGERSSVTSVSLGSRSSLSSAVTEKSSGNRQGDRSDSHVSLRSFKSGGRNTTTSHTSKKSSSLKDALGSRTSVRNSRGNDTRTNSRNEFEMSKSQTSLKSRVSQQNVRSRPGTGRSVKRSESRASRTSVKGSPYETDLLPSAVTRNASHESLKSTSSKVSIKSTKSKQSGKSVISSRQSSACFRSAVSQESDRSGTDGGFRTKMNEDSNEAAVKQDEPDMSDFKHNSKKEYDIPCANIKEGESPINQVGKDNENSETGNNDAGDDVEGNLKSVRDFLEDLKSPNHIVRDETNGRANEQISE